MNLSYPYFKILQFLLAIVIFSFAFEAFLLALRHYDMIITFKNAEHTFMAFWSENYIVFLLRLIAGLITLFMVEYNCKLKNLFKIFIVVFLFGLSFLFLYFVMEPC